MLYLALLTQMTIHECDKRTDVRRTNEQTDRIAVAYAALCAGLRSIKQFFIARQHAMHAECDFVLQFLSACPSNAGIESKRTDISSHFL